MREFIDTTSSIWEHVKNTGEKLAVPQEKCPKREVFNMILEHVSLSVYITNNKPTTNKLQPV